MSSEVSDKYEHRWIRFGLPRRRKVYVKNAKISESEVDRLITNLIESTRDYLEVKEAINVDISYLKKSDSTREVLDLSPEDFMTFYLELMLLTGENKDVKLRECLGPISYALEEQLKNPSKLCEDDFVCEDIY